MDDLLAELRNEADSMFRHPDIDGLITRAADEIERLRNALRPFADYYDLLERNGYLKGFDLISRQDGRVLGHAGVQAVTLKAAKDALNQQLTREEK